MSIHTPMLSLLLGAGLLSNSLAFAGQSEINDAAAVLSAPISMAQATTIAQASVAGKPAQAQFDIEGNRPVWVIELVDAQQQVHELTIDAQTGALIAQAQDPTDDAEAHNEKED